MQRRTALLAAAALFFGAAQAGAQEQTSGAQLYLFPHWHDLGLLWGVRP